MAKILYQVHFDDAQVFECKAMTLKIAIAIFRFKHPDAAINQFMLIGAYGNWISISVDQIATLERVIQSTRARRAAA